MLDGDQRHPRNDQTVQFSETDSADAYLYIIIFFVGLITYVSFLICVVFVQPRNKSKDEIVLVFFSCIFLCEV